MPVFRLRKEPVFPDPALAEEDGLLAVGGDLRPDRLVAAYSSGIFPWYSQGEPILWFSPDPRMILYPERFKLAESLARTIRSGKYETRADTAFESVIRACAAKPRPGQRGTWITPAMRRAYIDLHSLGLAHSLETYENGRLVGGLYGVSLGKAFFGESMFFEARDASKVALAALVDFARRQGFAFIDAQQPTKHLESLGAQPIPRARFLRELAEARTAETLSGPWTTLLGAAQG